jgi:hypothetical protein
MNIINKCFCVDSIICLIAIKTITATKNIKYKLWLQRLDIQTNNISISISLKINVIDYITITCNLKKCLITDYIRLHEKCNRLQPITITNYDYPQLQKILSINYDFKDLIFKQIKFQFQFL